MEAGTTVGPSWSHGGDTAMVTGLREGGLERISQLFLALFSNLLPVLQIARSSEQLAHITGWQMQPAMVSSSSI